MGGWAGQQVDRLLRDPAQLLLVWNKVHLKSDLVGTQVSGNVASAAPSGHFGSPRVTACGVFGHRGLRRLHSHGGGPGRLTRVCPYPSHGRAVGLRSLRAPHGMSLPSEPRRRMSRVDPKASGSPSGKRALNFDFHLCLHFHLGL